MLIRKLLSCTDDTLGVESFCINDQLLQTMIQQIQDAYRRHHDQSKTLGSLMIVGISGPSASGKSTVAQYVGQILERDKYSVYILRQDDFIIPEKQPDPKWTCGHVDMAALRLCLSTLKHERRIEKKPRYNQTSASFDTESLDVSHTDILIFEGLYANMFDDVDFGIQLRTIPSQDVVRRWLREQKKQPEAQKSPKKFAAQAGYLFRDIVMHQEMTVSKEWMRIDSPIILNGAHFSYTNAEQTLAKRLSVKSINDIL